MCFGCAGLSELVVVLVGGGIVVLSVCARKQLNSTEMTTLSPAHPIAHTRRTVRNYAHNAQQFGRPPERHRGGLCARRDTGQEMAGHWNARIYGELTHWLRRHEQYAFICSWLFELFWSLIRDHGICFEQSKNWWSHNFKKR